MIHAFLRVASDEDGGNLWGRPLYGPILFVDPPTRYVVANQQDAHGDRLERHTLDDGDVGR